MRKIALPAYLIALLVAAATAAVLLVMGQPAICTCGTVEIWAGGASGPKTSQMIADWYTPSHVIHGFLFYGLMWLLWKRRPVEHRYMGALLLEAGWEILENSPMVLERYRAVTVEVGYHGDSVLNSMADLGWMTVGFLIARKLPLWAIATLAIAFEVAALIAIRNNLTLSVLMLTYPIDAVREWQAAGGLA